MKKNKKKVLIVAAHPDDEVLGCGGTIYKLGSEGHDVSVLFLSDGVASRIPNKLDKEINRRKKSAIKSCKILKVKNCFFENLADNAFDTESLLNIIKLIEKYIDKLKPEIIFTHSNSDLNVDHQVTNQSVVTACRPQKNLSVKELYFFEILSSTEWNFSDSEKHFKPNYFIDISKCINKKIAALKKYEKEIRKWPHPRSLEGARILSRYRGMASNMNYAEAFFQAFKINK